MNLTWKTIAAKDDWRSSDGEE